MEDLKDREFDQLTVKRLGDPRRSGGEIRDWRWWCLCSCGREVAILASNLKAGHTRSCGHLKGRHFRTHGETGQGKGKSRKRTPEYDAWCSMKQRCLDKNSTYFKDYGGRGITICDRWLESYENFLADVGRRPLGCTLDRTNNNLGYFPGNCKWRTPLEQGRNKRNNRWITFEGETLTLSEWSRKTGLNPSTIRRRLKAGWLIERALTASITCGRWTK